MLGFIILRHVSNKKYDRYWKLSYQSIRKFYPDNQILLIDDNSNYDLIDLEFEHQMKNVKIIRSEYPRRGELLPYIYYLENKLFDQAVIIHDSVFINKKFDFNNQDCRFIWHFSDHRWDQIADERKMLNIYNDPQLLEFHNDKKKWHGCFGGMTVIKYDFLSKLDKKYGFKKLTPFIKTRYNRQSFERVFACLVQNELGLNNSLLGEIHRYCRWGLTFENMNKKLPMIKVWSGR